MEERRITKLQFFQLRLSWFLSCLIGLGGQVKLPQEIIIPQREEIFPDLISVGHDFEKNLRIRVSIFCPLLGFIESGKVLGKNSFWGNWVQHSIGHTLEETSFRRALAWDVVIPFRNQEVLEEPFYFPS